MGGKLLISRQELESRLRKSGRPFRPVHFPLKASREIIPERLHLFSEGKRERGREKERGPEQCLHMGHPSRGRKLGSCGRKGWTAIEAPSLGCAI